MPFFASEHNQNTTHNNLIKLITLLNKVRIDILRRHLFPKITNFEIKIAFLRINREIKSYLARIK